MSIKIFAGICCMVFWDVSSSGQCPDKALLLKRMNSLRDSLKPPSHEQLSELLPYLDRMNACPVKNDSVHALLYKRIGGLYYQEGDYVNALKYYPQFITIIRANAGNPLINQQQLVGGYYWLSKIYESLNRRMEKMRGLDSCVYFAGKFKVIDRSVLRSLYELVEYYYDIGDYHRSIDYATRCETVSREYAKLTKGEEYKTAQEYASSSLLWKVNAMLILYKDKSAEDFLANKPEEFKRAGFKRYMGSIYWLMAEVQMFNKKYDKALLFFNLALKADQEAGDDFGSKQTWNTMGTRLYRDHLNDADKALSCYRNAMKYVVRDPSFKENDTYESLNILTNIGEVFAQKNIYDSAFRYFQLAFDQIRPGIDEKVILHSAPGEIINHKNLNYLNSLLISKGDVFKKKYGATKQIQFLKEAVSVYKLADQMLDKIRTQQSDLRSKLYWRNDSRRLYEHAIDACFLQGNTTDAFYFFEKSRAVLLNDQLNEQRWIGESDILKQTQLKKKIQSLEYKLSKTDPSAQEHSIIKEEIFLTMRELDRLAQLIKNSNPLYYQNYLDTNFITLKYVQQKLLREQHALLEMFSGDSAVYALLITTKNSYLSKINRRDFENISGKYISYLANANLLNRDFDGFEKISAQLYDLIFHYLPVVGNRIIISPDGQYFPFEALITGRADQAPKWFLEGHAVSYTYSARFLMNDFYFEPVSAGNFFLGIAPINYATAFSLEALPGSDRSLYKIAGYFNNGVNLVSLDATRRNFLQQFSQYKIIQLYTHASDSSMNNEPVIYFADSALYLSDLIHENKPLTRLVVLSACETGGGKNYQGEGVFSFNRGFAALGIPAAITNLWSVDNESTYMLTELFYKWLAKGLPTDVALQKAKLEFLQTVSKEKSLPFYWAAPVLVGKAEIIELSKPYPWKWVAIFAAIGLVVFWTMRRRFVQRQRLKEKSILN